MPKGLQGFQKGHKLGIGNKYSLGFKHSAATREKLSLARRGNTNAKGAKRSEEHREAISKAQAGENNWQWQGENVKYRPLHHWVQRQLGKPDTCESCKQGNLSGHQIHWANKSGDYRRSVDDWIRLCAKCHREYDYGLQQDNGVQEDKKSQE